MEYVKLNTLCEINIGKTPSRNKSIYWGSGNKWLSISDLKEKYISKSKEEITDIAVEESNMKLVPKDTVIMSFKLSIGKVAILKEDMFTNEAIANFKIKDKSLITPEYLYYALKTLNFDNTDRAVMGATLNKSKLNDIKIPYCDVETQKKIVEVLDKAQELIDKRKEQIEALDELVKSRFIEMFGNPLNNPKGFKKVKIKELIDIKIEKSKKVFDSEDIISYIDISCIDNMSNKIINSNKYNFSEAPSRAQQCIKVGDILISTVRPNLKNIAIVQYELENMVTTSGVTILRSKNINKSFLFQYVLTDYFTDEMISLTSGANYPAIKPSDIYNHEIINPPMELQNQFADFVKQVEKLKSQMETSLKELEDNFNSLMQKAFKGELF